MNTQKGFAPILIILLGVVMIGGGVYFYTEINNQSLVEKSEVIDSEQNELSNTDINEVATTDGTNQEASISQDEVFWKTYASQKLNFSLKIPNNVKVSEHIDENNNLINFSGNNNFSVRVVGLGVYGDSIDNWRFKMINTLPVTETQVAGKRAFQYFIPAHGEGGEQFSDEIIIIFEHDEKIYHFEFYATNNLTKEQNKILSSVLLMQGSSNTSQVSNNSFENWEQYSGETFSIKYPSSWRLVEVNSTYGAGGEKYIAGLELIPKGDHEQGADFRIYVGGKQLSVCSDVDGATKCVGGGKSNTPLIYTYSSEDYIHEAFDEIIEINK